MKLGVAHESTYRFDPAMRGVVQSLRLTPSVFETQLTHRWSIEIDGATLGSGFRDGAGDWIETAMVLGPVDSVTVRVSGDVETTDAGGILKGHKERVRPETYMRPTQATKPDRALTDLAAHTVSSLTSEQSLDAAHALANAVSDAIAYTPGQTRQGTTAAEALALGHGVCADHAHSLIALAIASEIPARYVTGYLLSSEPGASLEATHAWAELWVKDVGWIGFDPSNRTCPDERYIRIGSGADASEAAPIRGVAQGMGEEGLEIAVSVTQSQQ